VLAALVDQLGLKLAQRRWWGVVPHESGALLVAEGGGALADWRVRAGGGRALQRALQTAGLVRFDDGDPHLAVSADAQSGIVLPLRHGAHLAGLLAVESTRRRDLLGLDARLAREQRPWSLELRLAGFRAWHAARWGVEPAFDVEVDEARRWLEDVLAAARAEGPLALCGAPATGRRVLSRWAHFESARRGGPWLEHVCGALEPHAEAQRLFADDGLLHAARAGTLHLAALERLAPALQARLAERLGSGDAAARARLIVALAKPLGEGALQPELARRLSRLELFVPTLAERRAELPLLAQSMLRRFARELSRGEVSADDEVTAWLWRQPWHGNLRELEDLLYRLVLCTPRRELALDDLRAVAHRSRLELVARVPSRDVDPGWIRAALAVTRTRRGGENKTRAALYLGWDPDTLARARAMPAEPE
jgi:transcriptional regulator of acetoin/glycerol metabolism